MCRSSPGSRAGTGAQLRWRRRRRRQPGNARDPGDRQKETASATRARGGHSLRSRARSHRRQAPCAHAPTASSCA
jgi:hypothetical protein